MKKSKAKKSTNGRKKKRPSSVLSKAWKTRRKKKAAAARLANKAAKAVVAAATDHPLTDGALMGTRHSDVPQTQPPKTLRDVQTDRIMLAADLKMDSPTRGAVQHELRDMIDHARFKGVSAGMDAQKQRTDDELLCGIVAMYRLWVEHPHSAAHSPFVLSRNAGKALVEKLEALGYSAKGKRVPPETEARTQWRVTERENAE